MPEHEDLLPTDAASNRGNHVIEGIQEVADETALAALSLASGERGKVVYQTGGVSPGWYLIDGAGDKHFMTGPSLGVVAPNVSFPGAVEYWDAEIGRTVDGSNNVTNWVGQINSMDLQPTSTAPQGLPLDTTEGTESYPIGGGFIQNQNGVRFDGVAAEDLRANLPSAWAVSDPVYIGVWCRLPPDSASAMAFGVDGGLSMWRNGTTGMGVVHLRNGGGFATPSAAIGNNYWVHELGYWEMMHERVGSAPWAYQHLARSGVPIMSRYGVATESDNDFDSTPSEFVLGIDPIAHPTIGDSVVMDVGKIVIANSIPTPFQRRKLMQWARGYV